VRSVASHSRFPKESWAVSLQMDEMVAFLKEGPSATLHVAAGMGTPAVRFALGSLCEVDSLLRVGTS
jgi:hypothetical protein